MADGAVKIGADQIPAFNLIVMRSALKLETFGLRHSKGSVVPMVKDVLVQHGIVPNRNKKELLVQYTDLLKAIGVLV